MAETAQFDRAYSYCEIHIKRDEDWNDATVLQRMMADGSINDLDLSDVARLDLYIRPRFDHNTLIRQLSSVSTIGGISYRRDVAGEVSIFLPRATVIAGIPVGQWDQFLTATYDNGRIDEFWRGPLYVHPGKVS